MWVRQSLKTSDLNPAFVDAYYLQWVACVQLIVFGSTHDINWVWLVCIWLSRETCFGYCIVALHSPAFCIYLFTSLLVVILFASKSLVAISHLTLLVVQYASLKKCHKSMVLSILCKKCLCPHSQQSCMQPGFNSIPQRPDLRYCKGLE